MAIRNILNKSDQDLRKKSKDVEKFDSRLHQLLDDMYETMIDDNGVGLAAPQVGVLKNAIVVNINDHSYEMLNPKILKSQGSCVAVEGCLSCPNQWGFVTRAESIEVEYKNRFGETKTMKAKDYLARVILHECDHLKGVLFIDIADKILTEEELQQYLEG